jgi:ribonuclease HII
MASLALEYPQYNLDKNSGYGQDYINLVKQHGIPAAIHRHTYKIKNGTQTTLF